MSKSLITTKKTQLRRPAQGWNRTVATHPGQMLREDFLPDYNLTGNQLAAACQIPISRVYDILSEKRGISADTALRLSTYFGNSPEFWMNAQAGYDLVHAREKMKGVRIFGVESGPLKGKSVVVRNGPAVKLSRPVAAKKAAKGPTAPGQARATRG